MKTGEWVCSECGVDVPRAAMVTAVAMFYTTTYQCPRCPFVTAETQAAVNHMAAQHEHDLAAYFERATTKSPGSLGGFE